MSDSTIEKSRWQRFAERGLKSALAPGALVILYVFFAIFGRNYFSYPTLIDIINASYYIGFIAIGVTFVIITAGIDLSIGTVTMAAAIIGGTALKVWHWPMLPSLLLILAVGFLFGLFNGIMVSRVKMPPFIVTLGTMMISMGVGSIVANVRAATFPVRGEAGGWFKNIFMVITPKGVEIPTGAILLVVVAIVCHILLSNTKLGRYTYAIGSNKEAARLSGVDVQRWEMIVYIIAGITAGIGGISYAAIYTTVLPAQGQGFELLAIAAAVIGGTSLYGGIGTVWGTIIGVFIMSVLSTGLPAMNLQSQWQTFFTGVIVIGAVLLDMYRTKKTSEVRVETPARQYRSSMMARISAMTSELSAHREAGRTSEAAQLRKQIDSARAEMKATFRKMKAEEKANLAQMSAEARAADREYIEMLKKRDQTKEGIVAPGSRRNE